MEFGLRYSFFNNICWDRTCGYAFFTGRFITIRCRHFCAGVHNDIGQTAELNLGITLLLLIIAAIVGDALNYFIGKNIGLKLLNWKLNDKQIVNSKYIAKTNKFYELHGPKTIIIARFIPIVRTFALL
jgi:membrane-associated protein